MKIRNPCKPHFSLYSLHRIGLLAWWLPKWLLKSDLTYMLFKTISPWGCTINTWLSPVPVAKSDARPTCTWASILWTGTILSLRFTMKSFLRSFSPFRWFRRRAIVSYWRKNGHRVLVNHLEGLSLPRKSVVMLTGRPAIYSCWSWTLNNNTAIIRELCVILFNVHSTIPRKVCIRKHACSSSTSVKYKRLHEEIN